MQAPTNLTAILNDTSVVLTWNAPTAGANVERYAITWVDGNNGWGVASYTTSITLSKDLFAGTGGLDKTYQLHIRSDNDTLHLYSADSNIVNLFIPSKAPELPPSPPVQPEPTYNVPVIETPSPIAPATEEQQPPTEILLPTQVPEIESPPLEEPPPPPAEESPTQEIVSPEPQNPLPESPPQDTAPLTVDQIETIINNLVSNGNITESDSQAILENLRADGEVTSSEVNALSDVLSADGQFTEAERAVVADALIEAAAGEAVTKEDIKDAGLTYEDLPPTTPVEVRQDENGNEVIITADVAAALVLLENPSELIGAIFSDPGQALQALGNIGADMSPQEREESQKMVVAAVIAGNAAINAVAAAAGAAGGTRTGGNGGGSSGGGGSSDSKGVRRRRP